MPSRSALSQAARRSTFPSEPNERAVLLRAEAVEVINQPADGSLVMDDGAHLQVLPVRAVGQVCASKVGDTPVGGYHLGVHGAASTAGAAPLGGGPFPEV